MYIRNTLFYTIYHFIRETSTHKQWHCVRGQLYLQELDNETTSLLSTASVTLSLEDYKDKCVHTYTSTSIIIVNKF